MRTLPIDILLLYEPFPSNLIPSEFPSNYNNVLYPLYIESFTFIVQPSYFIRCSWGWSRRCQKLMDVVLRRIEVQVDQTTRRPCLSWRLTRKSTIFEKIQLGNEISKILKVKYLRNPNKSYPSDLSTPSNPPMGSPRLLSCILLDVS